VPVIPAKAGICSTEEALRQIPAFAGMTDQKHGCRKLVLLPIMKRIPLGPVAVDLIDFPSLRAALRAAIIDNTPSQIVTLNALMFNLALHDDALAGIIKRAALIVPESSGICWAISFLSALKHCGSPVLIFCMISVGRQLWKDGASTFWVHSRALQKKRQKSCSVFIPGSLLQEHSTDIFHRQKNRVLFRK
jgi:hypothetical protein